MPNRHDIHILNGLIATTMDSAERLDRVAQGGESSGHDRLFRALAAERRDMAQAMSDQIVALGGRADLSGSVLGKAQRAFLDIGHALLNDEAGLVDAADRGEAALARRFEAALADPRLSPTTRETVARAHAAIRRETDEVHGLRRSLDGQRDAASQLYPQ